MVTTKTVTHYAEPLAMSTRGVLTQDELGFATNGQIYETEVIVPSLQPAYVGAAGASAFGGGPSVGGGGGGIVLVTRPRRTIHSDLKEARKILKHLAARLHPDRHTHLPTEDRDELYEQFLDVAAKFQQVDSDLRASQNAIVPSHLVYAVASLTSTLRSLESWVIKLSDRAADTERTLRERERDAKWQPPEVRYRYVPLYPMPQMQAAAAPLSIASAGASAPGQWGHIVFGILAGATAMLVAFTAYRYVTARRQGHTNNPRRR